MNRDQKILIQHSQVLLPDAGHIPTSRTVLVTLMSNISYFGFALSQSAFSALQNAGDTAVERWWELTEPVLMNLTGDDKDMGSFVVYKNFPHEVLSMSEADYWFRQICMYWGLPNELFTTEPEARPDLKEVPVQRVLHPAGEDSLPAIFEDLLASPARWIDEQQQDVIYLAVNLEGQPNLSQISFKENLVTLGVACLEQGQTVTVDTATDVLRLAVGMSEGDVSLRQNSKLRRFRRPERRFLLQMMDQASHLEEDLSRRPEQMKRLLHGLRPGDYPERFPRVCLAYDKLYRDQLPQTFNARVEALLEQRDRAVLSLLQQRPGELMRRLHTCVLLFRDDTVHAFTAVVDQLSTIQLLKLQRYLETVNDRSYRTFPPRGNWSKLQVVETSPDRRIPIPQLRKLLTLIAQHLSSRLEEKVGPVRLDPRTVKVKLQTSDSDLLPYGRGTTFFIPEPVTFIRTASYWHSGSTHSNIWYDNGWNFFGDNWSPQGACCWTEEKFSHGGAVFSGDPTNSKNLEGRACQMIDLYLDKLQAVGVRYAVWNILCYSRLTFSDAQEVYAALMWGEKPEEGKLFEPSRCQLSFPLTGNSLTKYVAYLDLWRRELIFIDANLRGSVSTAAANTKGLSERIPAFVEYLNSLPSMHDLLSHAPQADDGLPVLYSDLNVPIQGGKAWVFRPENKSNSFESLQINELLK